MEKRFTCIAKVGRKNGQLVGNEGFIKYRSVTNLLKFVQFLDREYPDWRFFNVYSKKTKIELGRFTKNKRPTGAYL